jgi:cell division inhibitor SepF
MNLFQRLRDALGLDEYYEYEDYGAEVGADPGAYDTGSHSPGRKFLSGNVIGMPVPTMEMVMMQPHSFDEIPKAVTALRERKSIVLDLSLMDMEQAQRCADYVAGGAFAIDGHQKQLGPNVFLFTPNFVQISHYATGELKPEMRTEISPEEKF